MKLFWFYYLAEKWTFEKWAHVWFPTCVYFSASYFLVLVDSLLFLVGRRLLKILWQVSAPSAAMHLKLNGKLNNKTQNKYWTRGKIGKKRPFVSLNPLRNFHPSIHPSVRPSVHPSIHPPLRLICLFKWDYPLRGALLLLLLLLLLGCLATDRPLATVAR